METKYIKVKVSERLPDKTEWYYTEEGLMYWVHDKQYWEDIDGNEDAVGIDFYFEEVPDREDEMIDMLKEAKLQLSRIKGSMMAHPDCTEGSEFDDYTDSAEQCENKIEALLNSIKQ